MLRNSILVGLTILAGGVAPKAWAADNDPPINTTVAEKSDFSGRVGVMGMTVPKAQGSDEYKITPAPMVDITWKDLIFLNRDGLGAYAVSTDNFHFGAAVNYASGQDSSDVGLGSDIGKLDGGASGALVARYNQGPFYIGAKVSHQFTGTDTGYLGTVSAGGMIPIGDQFLAMGSIGVEYADSKYMESYFGVSGAQSSATGIAAYSPNAGFKSVDLSIGLGYRLSDNWMVMGTGGYSRLLGDAASRPVTKDENQFMAGIGIAYSFGTQGPQ
jgi:MipA family protein